MELALNDEQTALQGLCSSCQTPVIEYAVPSNRVQAIKEFITETTDLKNETFFCEKCLKRNLVVVRRASGFVEFEYDAVRITLPIKLGVEPDLCPLCTRWTYRNAFNSGNVLENLKFLILKSSELGHERYHHLAMKNEIQNDWQNIHKFGQIQNPEDLR